MYVSIFLYAWKINDQFNRIIFNIIKMSQFRFLIQYRLWNYYKNYFLNVFISSFYQIFCKIFQCFFLRSLICFFDICDDNYESIVFNTCLTEFNHKKLCEIMKCFVKFRMMSKSSRIKWHVCNFSNFDKNVIDQM